MRGNGAKTTLADQRVGDTFKAKKKKFTEMKDGNPHNDFLEMGL